MHVFPFGNSYGDTETWLQPLNTSTGPFQLCFSVLWPPGWEPAAAGGGLKIRGCHRQTRGSPWHVCVWGARQCLSDRVGNWVVPPFGPVKKRLSVLMSSKLAPDFAWEGWVWMIGRDRLSAKGSEAGHLVFFFREPGWGEGAGIRLRARWFAWQLMYWDWC